MDQVQREARNRGRRRSTTAHAQREPHPPPPDRPQAIFGVEGGTPLSEDVRGLQDAECRQFELSWCSMKELVRDQEYSGQLHTM